jgi:hypothetical protein
MHAADRFLKFAAECEVMAKFTRNPENRAVWNGLAQRWIRCAQLTDQVHTTIHRGGAVKRRHTSGHDLSH